MRFKNNNNDDAPRELNYLHVFLPSKRIIFGCKLAIVHYSVFRLNQLACNSRNVSECLNNILDAIVSWYVHGNVIRRMIL